MDPVRPEKTFTVSLGDGSTSITIRGSAFDSSFDVAMVEQEGEYPIRGEDLSGYTVVDIGAGYGEFSALCYLLGASKILCFEPNAHVFEYLEQNLKDLPNIELNREAVFSRDGRTFLFSRQRGTASGSISEVQYDPDHPSAQDREKHEVDLVSISKILTDIPYPVLLKIDAEGVEYEIVDVAQKLGLLATTERIFIEYHAGIGQLPVTLGQSGFSVDVYEKDSRMGLIDARRRIHQ